MAVYKSISKQSSKGDDNAPTNGVRKNKQRVLILSSRGVTYRWVSYTINTQRLLHWAIEWLPWILWVCPSD